MLEVGISYRKIIMTFTISKRNSVAYITSHCR
jgi:hypothetical protein